MELDVQVWFPTIDVAYIDFPEIRNKCDQHGTSCYGNRRYCGIAEYQHRMRVMWEFLSSPNINSVKYVFLSVMFYSC